MNGWTQEKLDAYLKERAAQKAAFEGASKPQQVKVESTTKYNPHSW